MSYGLQVNDASEGVVEKGAETGLIVLYEAWVEFNTVGSIVLTIPSGVTNIRASSFTTVVREFWYAGSDLTNPSHVLTLNGNTLSWDKAISLYSGSYIPTGPSFIRVTAHG